MDTASIQGMGRLRREWKVFGAAAGGSDGSLRSLPLVSRVGWGVFRWVEKFAENSTERLAKRWDDRQEKKISADMKKEEGRFRSRSGTVESVG